MSRAVNNYNTNIKNIDEYTNNNSINKDNSISTSNKEVVRDKNHIMLEAPSINGKFLEF